MGSKNELTAKVKLRPINDGDLGFLRRLYATTRDDVENSPLSPLQKAQFVASQFDLQHKHYHDHFRGAEFSLISKDGEPIGRVYVGQTNEEVRLIELSLLPEFRGQGIGSKLISGVMDQAKKAGLPLRLRVDPQKPAKAFYERLGFRVIADEGSNLHMEWNPKKKR